MPAKAKTTAGPAAPAKGSVSTPVATPTTSKGPTATKVAKATANVKGETPNGSIKWTLEDALKLVFLVWQKQDPSMSVSGWKDIMDDIPDRYNNRFTGRGAQQYFQRLRNTFLKENPSPTQTATGAGAAVALKNPRKRAAPIASTSASVMDNETGGAVRSHKAKIQKKSGEKVVGKDTDNNDADEAMDDEEDL